MKTKTILIPFVGFYESIASQKAEDIAFQNYIFDKDIKENDKGQLDIPEDMTEAEQADFYDNYYPENIQEIRKGIAIDYIKHFANELGINAVFESIDSPRFYNYTTDRLFVNVPQDDLIELYNRTNQTTLAETIKEIHESRPGFDSYYSSDINDPIWQDPALFDHNQWNTVIEAKVKQDDINLEDLYWI